MFIITSTKFKNMDMRSNAWLQNSHQFMFSLSSTCSSSIDLEHKEDMGGGRKDWASGMLKEKRWDSKEIPWDHYSLWLSDDLFCHVLKHRKVFQILQSSSFKYGEL